MEPTQEFIDNVVRIMGEMDSRFAEDEGLSHVLAHASWKHNYPLPKSVFEQGEDATIEFSESNANAIQQFLDKLETIFSEFAEDDKPSMMDKVKGALGGGNKGATASKNEDGSWTVKYEGKSTTVQADSMADAIKKGKAKLMGNGGSGGGREMSESILQALNLNSDADEDDILAAIQTLQSSQFSEDDRSDFEAMKFRDRVMYYMEQVAPLTVIQGTQREKAEKLAHLEFTMGEEAVVERFREWESFQEASDQAGVTTRMLASNTSDDLSEKPAHKKVKEYAEKNNVSEQVALAHFADNDLSVFVEYDREAQPVA